MPVHGDVLRLEAAHGGEGLPDLPTRADFDDWRLDVAASSAALSYGNANEHWDAQLDYPLGLSPSMRLTHAFRLTDKLGAGTRMRQGDGLSEVMFNAVYAYRPNVRLRFAVGERRIAADDADGVPVEQHSYLLSAKKYWKRQVRTDASVTLYGGRARNAMEIDPEDEDEMDFMVSSWSTEPSRSKLHGYALNLGLAPAALTRIELRHTLSRSSHWLGHHFSRSEIESINRIRIKQDLGNCMLFSGGFTGGTATRHLDFQLQRSGWRIQARKALGDDDSASILIAYSSALGRAQAASGGCEDRQHEQPKFEPMLRAAADQPADFRYLPLGGGAAD